MTFEEWKKEAQLHAEVLGLPPDLWSDADDYDLLEVALIAFGDGVTPEAFIEDMFAEDLASMAHDSELRTRSLEEDS